MTLTAAPQAINGQIFYKLSMIELPIVDEEGNSTMTVGYYQIPATCTILFGRDGNHDIIRHTIDTPELTDQLKASSEYLADDNPGLMTRRLRIARLCVTVFHGEPDEEGVRQSESLEDYIVRGGDPLEIVESAMAGNYLKAERM
ncbi:hypothetical protein [Desulfoluna spongiiphila]|uniref:hypothetical protein n=1 Tax=Desulfoluna spongiiphila TaxID=419481 RepID=UPI0012591216|nr:hypothetical protein [Desulfoluna spongiiphila]VVS95365.1 hypothetical protein DBB_49420 [Desulfoluna spongiiphila]